MLPLSASASPRWRPRRAVVHFSRDWSHSGSDKSHTPWWSSPVSRRLWLHFILMLYQNHVISAQRYSYISLKTLILEFIFSPSNWWSLLPLVTLLVSSVPSSRTQLTTLCLSSTRTQALLPVKVSKQFYFDNLKLLKVLNEMGWYNACTKGLGARIIMIGTLTALQWFIYDGVKVALRLPRPPPPQMPESLRQKLEAQEKKE